MVSAIEAARLPFTTSGPSASAAKFFRFPEDEENRSHLTPIGCKDVEDGGRGFEPRTSVVVIIVVVVIVVVVVVVVVVIIVVIVVIVVIIVVIIVIIVIVVIVVNVIIVVVVIIVGSG